jgi:hypothetical protein
MKEDLKMNIDLDSLKSIIKGIRDEKYPSIPDTVIDRILSSASEHQDDPSASLPEIRAIVNEYIKSK